MDNMKPTGVEVDWHVTAQLLRQARALAPDAVIGRVAAAAS